MTCDFKQCGISISVDSDEPVQPHFKLRNSKLCSVSSFTVVEYSSDLQRLWSDCAYAQADLRFFWSYISHCWKYHATAHILFMSHGGYVIMPQTYSIFVPVARSMWYYITTNKQTLVMPCRRFGTMPQPYIISRLCHAEAVVL